MNIVHQDWDVQYVYLDTKSKEKKENKSNKCANKENKENKMDKKIEAGDMKIKKTPADTGKEIQKKRNELKLSQKELALRVNVLPKVIMDIENGKAKHNPQLISKIKRNLKIN
jgi:ribosome-binding protein aMBF1 (putative translation factor)